MYKYNIKKLLKKERRINTMARAQMTFEIDEDLRTEINIIAKKQKTTVKAIMTKLAEDFVRENKE